MQMYNSKIMRETGWIGVNGVELKIYKLHLDLVKTIFHHVLIYSDGVPPPSTYLLHLLYCSASSLVDQWMFRRPRFPLDFNINPNVH